LGLGFFYNHQLFTTITKGSHYGGQSFNQEKNKNGKLSETSKLLIKARYAAMGQQGDIAFDGVIL
jgi:hypothetical protein